MGKGSTLGFTSRRLNWMGGSKGITSGGGPGRRCGCCGCAGGVCWANKGTPAEMAANPRLVRDGCFIGIAYIISPAPLARGQDELWMLELVGVGNQVEINAAGEIGVPVAGGASVTADAQK